MSNTVAAAKKSWKQKPMKRENDRAIIKIVSPMLGLRGAANVMSLPAAHWKFERALATACPAVNFQFFGIERDPVVWSRARATAKRINCKATSRYRMTHRPIDAATCIENAAQSDRLREGVNLVYLDWMGTWEPGKRKQIHDMFDGRLFSKHAFLVLTLMGARGRVIGTTDDRRIAELEVDSLQQLSRLRLDENTERFIIGSRQSTVDKVLDVIGCVKAAAAHHKQTEEGPARPFYSAELERFAVYNDKSKPAEHNRNTPEMSFLFRIRKTKA